MRPLKFLAVFIFSTLRVQSTLSTQEITNREYLNDQPTSFFREATVRHLFHGRFTFDSYIQNAMTSIQLVMGIDLDSHRYDNEADLESAFVDNYNLGGAASHQDLCQRQLEALSLRSNELFRNLSSFSQSKDLALIEFLDSFGSPEARMMKGNLVWLGDYQQCESLKIDLDIPENSLIETRYCIVGYQAPDWYPEHMIKLGVCLPQGCDGNSLVGNEHHLDKLVRMTRLRQFPFSGYQLTRIFCLPDEDSTMRSLSLSAKIFALFITGWLILILYHSLRYEVHYFSRHKEQKTDKWSNIFAFRLIFNQLFGLAEGETKNVKPNIKQLDTRTSMRKDAVSNDKCDISVKSKEQVLFHLNQCYATSRRSSKLPSVDLSVIDGIKVISMIWLISAHTLLFFIRNTTNGSDFWSVLKDARFMTVMAGIFPVDTFFTITGILTGYLKFKKNDGRDLKSVKFWMKNFFHRYFRFLPMYLLIFWYIRDISEYMGRGPMWDYGTANTSIRALCKQESFISPILFQANTKPIEEHCVKPAWYLANDLQYLFITPLFMGLILVSAKTGYFFIVLSITGSLIMQFITVFYSSDIDDFETLINYKPMFGTYVLKNLWRLYVYPYNRIAPYLIGLITGYKMYKCYQEALETKKAHREKLEPADGRETWTRMLSKYLCLRIWKPLVVLMSIVYLPLASKLLTHHGLVAKLGTSSIMGFMRLVWSLAIARLVYVCSTSSLKNTEHKERSFVKSFLSSAKWKPWSKIGLSALLIQWEVICYLAQTQPNLPTLTMTFLLGTILLCVTCTYILAILLYILFEFPWSQIEQLHLRPAVFGSDSS